VSFRKLNIDDVNIFYREAGEADAPALLLLHGFPSASHMFRDLIPRLSPLRAGDSCRRDRVGDS
jgi:pimeloyl-ACP methyl ester carboxylesterase